MLTFDVARWPMPNIASVPMFEATTPVKQNARPQRRNCCMMLRQSPSVPTPVRW